MEGVAFLVLSLSWCAILAGFVMSVMALVKGIERNMMNVIVLGVAGFATAFLGVLVVPMILGPVAAICGAYGVSLTQRHVEKRGPSEGDIRAAMENDPIYQAYLRDKGVSDDDVPADGINEQTIVMLRNKARKGELTDGERLLYRDYLNSRR